jgi:hypothetical protein
VHPFWLSHEEKRPHLELSMEGQPRPELELHGRFHGDSSERGERGRGWGCGLGRAGAP